MDLFVGLLLYLAQVGGYVATHFCFKCFSFLFLAELVVGLTFAWIALRLCGDFTGLLGFGFAGLPS